MLTVEQMTTILIDVDNGTPREYQSEEAREFRKQMDKEVAEIKAKGWVVEIPFELPGPDAVNIRRGLF